MFKRENLRKNFLRVKQNIDQNLGRAEQSKVLTEDQEENEKRVEVVKHAFQNIAKKAGAVMQGSGTDFDKKLKKLPETGLSHAMTESAQSLGTDTLLGSVCQLCGDCQMDLAREHVQYEETVELEFITPLQTIVDVDIPGIIKWRKALTKSILDMDSAKSRLNQVVRQSQVPGANMISASAKADVIKDEYEEATLKMENIKDNLSIELCNFAAKESEQSSRLLMLLEAQANYHRKALEAIEVYIPQLTLAIQNSSAKPCYGMPLEEHLRLMCRDVALVLEACVLTLLETGMEEEGLFRLAGSSVKLKKLKACFDAHAVDMEEFSSDPHTVAGALKLYLRELPEPLLTFELYDDFMLSAMLAQDQRLQALWTVINRLPKPNYNNFRYLVKFLAKLAEKSDVNKMKPSNIAIVIGPNLIWSENNNSQNMMTTGPVSGIIESVVTHADWFFPGAFDFHLTGHGSSPALFRETGFAHNTNTHASDTKHCTEVEMSEKKIESNANKEPHKKKNKEKEDVNDETDDGVRVKILPIEQSLINLAMEFQKLKLEKEGDEDKSTDENNLSSDKYETQSALKTEPGKPENELDFNAGYLEGDGHEGGQLEKPQNSAEAAHTQVTSTVQVAHTVHSSSHATSPVPVSQSSPESLDFTTAAQKRVSRKPAPPPPPGNVIVVTTAAVKPGHSDGSVASGGGCDDVVDGTNSSQSLTVSITAPLACPESPTDQHKATGSQVKDKYKLPACQSERPSMPPPHRPDQAPPERPRLQSSLNPPTDVRGHRRSASTGALVNQTSGSLDSITIAGVPNAGSLSSYSIAEGSRNDHEGGGYISLNWTANAPSLVPPGSSHMLGHSASMRPRPTPPPPPNARESEYTKL